MVSEKPSNYKNANFLITTERTQSPIQKPYKYDRRSQKSKSQDSEGFGKSTSRERSRKGTILSPQFLPQKQYKFQQQPKHRFEDKYEDFGKKLVEETKEKLMVTMKNLQI